LEQNGVTQGLGVLDDTLEIFRHGDLAPGICAPLFLPQDDFARGETYFAGHKYPPLLDSGAIAVFTKDAI
jgi:hypothetical protein